MAHNSPVSQVVMDSAELYKYMDFLWVPAGMLVVRPNQRVLTALFIATCLMTLRMQAELVEGTGFSRGFLPWLQSSSRVRGEVVYNIVIALFLILARWSPNTKPSIFFAASLTVYILAFCASMVVMAL